MFAATPNISFRPGKIYSHVFNYRISIQENETNAKKSNIDCCLETNYSCISIRDKPRQMRFSGLEKYIWPIK